MRDIKNFCINNLQIDLVFEKQTIVDSWACSEQQTWKEKEQIVHEETLASFDGEEQKVENVACLVNDSRQRACYMSCYDDGFDNGHDAVDKVAVVVDVGKALVDLLKIVNDRIEPSRDVVC